MAASRLTLFVLLALLVLPLGTAWAQPIDGPYVVAAADAGYEVRGDDDDEDEDEDEDEDDDDGGDGQPTAPDPATPPSGALTAAVDVTDDKFTPATVDIRPGGTVTWTFVESGHNVTADDGSFEASQDSGTFSRTFDAEGRFTYQCTEHGGMDGVVVVRVPASEPDTAAPGAPAGLAATGGDRSVTLDWADADAPDLAGYRVERRAPDGSWAQVADVSASGHVDAGLVNGTGYGYRVRAYDLAGNVGEPSAAVDATPTAPAVAATERLVTVGGYGYGPENVVVNRGDTVVWSWIGPDVNHSVSSLPSSAEVFESHPGVPDQAVTYAPAGGTFRRRFDRTGAFDYFCRLHPDMTAKVTVVDSGADAAQAGLLKAVAAGGPKGAQAARAGAGKHTVKVADYKYTPRDLRIGLGDSVTWKWTAADRDHSVTTKGTVPESFDSHAGLKLSQIKDAPEGGDYTRTFTKLGTYTYYCRLHPDMTASVRVVSAARARKSGAPLRVRMRKARVRGRHRVTVRYVLSEKAKVRVQLKRGRKRLKTWRLKGRRGANAKRLTLPRRARRGGRFTLHVVATRANGDRSAPRRARVRVPRRR
jgi:plastocyanin